MLRFRVFSNDAAARSMSLDGAFLIGNDNVPVRGDLRFADGEIICEPRSRGPVALSVMWPVKGFGRIMLETTRLMERPEPYNLHVELARGRLVRISQKREDWGLFDFPEGESLYREVDAARDLLVEAITAPDEVTAARFGEAAVEASVLVGSRLGIFHADVFLRRRRSSNQMGKRPFGCRVSLANLDEPYIQRVSEAFDFSVVSFRWCDLEPREGENDWSRVESCLRALRNRKMHIRGCSLVSFEKSNLPHWTYLWEGDYEHMQDCLTRHLKRALTKFGSQVHAWEIISGIHAHNDFHFTFEQLMDLTRMSAMMAKQLAPRSASIIGITLPWGEYYTLDQRTIPPMLYAEMVVRNGINFDAFGLELRFGATGKETFVRDPMQISSMLDAFGSLGKPLHVTVVGNSVAGSRGNGAEASSVLASFARDCYVIALSKPFVETVTWQPPAADGTESLSAGSSAAYREIQSLRDDILGKSGR
ncbi:MAG: endo-1,4-beta-xylanase [Planctomycetota bacterium]|nr:endo-1,4-beta-xylanase [Planctomycetota bacterium]MCZ6816953.1 endo-1,4-beta-xylanase [Planctomycetota bacterium]